MTNPLFRSMVFPVDILKCLSFPARRFHSEVYVVEAPKQKNQKMISLLKHSMAAKLRGAAMPMITGTKITSFSKCCHMRSAKFTGI